MSGGDETRANNETRSARRAGKPIENREIQIPNLLTWYLSKCNNSVATRIAYALILLVNSLLSWLMMTQWAVKKLQGILLDYVTIDCAGKACFGFAAVHRVNFALGLLHFLLAVLLIGVNNSRDKRAALQNGFWGPKIIIWIGLIVATFFIPNSFFETWGNYVALIGAILFLLLGLVLLVDLAHTFAEYCIEKIEDTDSGLWRGVLIGSTLTMYLSAIAMTIVMYIFFAHSGCSMNQAAITVSWPIGSQLKEMLTCIDQSSVRNRNKRNGDSPHNPGVQSTRWPCAISNSLDILYIPHHECRRNGTRRPTLQPSGTRKWHTYSEYHPRCCCYISNLCIHHDSRRNIRPSNGFQQARLQPAQHRRIWKPPWLSGHPAL